MRTRARVCVHAYICACAVPISQAALISPTPRAGAFPVPAQPAPPPYPGLSSHADFSDFSYKPASGASRLVTLDYGPTLGADAPAACAAAGGASLFVPRDMEALHELARAAAAALQISGLPGFSPVLIGLQRDAGTDAWVVAPSGGSAASAAPAGLPATRQPGGGAVPSGLIAGLRWSPGEPNGPRVERCMLLSLATTLRYSAWVGDDPCTEQKRAYACSRDV